MTMFDLDPRGPVAHLRLNRPAARNAIAQPQWAELDALLERVVASGARVLVIRSATDGQFCAGADLRDLEALAGNPRAQAAMRSEMRAALDHLAALPIPTVAAIGGGCFGAGVALALACDVRVAGAAARFAIPPARLGITYPHADIYRLVGLIGWGQASRLLFTAANIGAAEAHAIGLVELCVEDAAAAADTLAADMAANAPSSLSLLKRSIALAMRGATESGELDAAFERGFDGADFAEGIAAMRMKRAPRFGR